MNKWDTRTRVKQLITGNKNNHFGIYDGEKLGCLSCDTLRFGWMQRTTKQEKAALRSACCMAVEQACGAFRSCKFACKNEASKLLHHLRTHTPSKDIPQKSFRCWCTGKITLSIKQDSLKCYNKVVRGKASQSLPAVTSTGKESRNKKRCVCWQGPVVLRLKTIASISINSTLLRAITTWASGLNAHISSKNT